MILFVDNKPDAVLETRIQFFRMGLPSLVYGTDALHMLFTKPAHTILIMRPECIENIEEVCRNIRTYVPRIPLALMYRPPLGNYYLYKRLGDAVFDDRITTVTFVKTMFDLYQERNGISPWEHCYGGLRVRLGAQSICIWGNMFPFNHEQVMLTRYLLFFAPHAVPTEELRQTCFRPDRLPQSGNVHTQFCRMNKIIRRGLDKPAFLYQKDYGYFIAPI